MGRERTVQCWTSQPTGQYAALTAFRDWVFNPFHSVSFSNIRFHAQSPVKSSDLPTLIAKTPLRLTKILQFFFFFLKTGNKKCETTSQSTLQWNLKYGFTETWRQNTKLPRDCFLNQSVTDFSPTCGRVHWTTNRNFQVHFGLRLQEPGECQIKKHLSGTHILAIPTTGNERLAQHYVSHVTHPVENNNCSSE